jgi:hypothetical protein
MMLDVRPTRNINFPILVRVLVHVLVHTNSLAVKLGISTLSTRMNANNKFDRIEPNGTVQTIRHGKLLTCVVLVLSKRKEEQYSAVQSYDIHKKYSTL